ncbi:hypothetical protein MMC17_008550 [Xylographa soralifera]|nr:hypothetical protein [Xylographa soralifera]
MSKVLRLYDRMDQALDNHLSMIPVCLNGILHWQPGLEEVDETVLLTLALNEESVHQEVGFFWVDTKDQSTHLTEDGTWFYQAKKWGASEKAEYLNLSNLERYDFASVPFGLHDPPMGQAIPISLDPADDCREESSLTRESLLFAHTLSSFILLFSAGRPYLFATHRLHKECSYSNSLTDSKVASLHSMVSFTEFLYGFDKFIEEVLNEEPTEELGSDIVREMEADNGMQHHKSADGTIEKDAEPRRKSVPADGIWPEIVAEPVHAIEAKHPNEATKQSKTEGETEAETLSNLGTLVLTESKSLRTSCASFKARRQSLKHKRQSSSIITEPIITSNEVEDLPSLSRMVSASSKSDSMFSKRPSTLSRMESFQSGTSPACNRASTYSVAASIQSNREVASTRRASTYSIAASIHSASGSVHGRSNSTVALNDSFYAPWDSFGAELHMSPIEYDAGPVVMRTFVTFDELVEDSAKADLADVCRYLAGVYDDPVTGAEYSLSWEVLSENLGKNRKQEEEGELMND